MKQSAIIGFLLILTLLVNYTQAQSETYISIKPREATVGPGEKVAFTVGLIKDGVVQQVLPWDFKFSSAKGSFSGSVYDAPEESGTYIVYVTYKDIQGVAMITVAAAEPVDRIEIQPGKIELEPGADCQFSAKVYGKSGKELLFNPAWGCKGGKIDFTGKYTAGTKTGKFSVVALGPQGAKATAEILIKDPTPRLTRLEMTPVEKKLYPQEKVAFTVKGYDQKGQPIEAKVSWEATGGEINSQGVFVAGNNPGEFTVTATEAKTQLNAKAVVTVTPEPVIATAVQITPAGFSLKIGEKTSFQAQVYDQKKRPMQTGVVWSTDGGTIDESGAFTAGDKPGEFIVIASVPDTQVKAQVKVVVQALPVAAPVLSNLKITPAEPAAVKPGEKVQFQAEAYDEKGQKMAAQVRWEATGGTITPQGEFTAGDVPGEYTITAGAGEVKASVKATIVAAIVEQTPEPEEENPQAITQLKVVPDQKTLAPGEQLQFKLEGQDSQGNPVELHNKNGSPVNLNVEWQATGGTITPEGLFTAGPAAGEYIIVATCNGMVTRSVIKVVASSTPEPATPQGTMQIQPSQVSLQPGESVKLEAYVVDEQNQRLSLPIEWEANGGTIDQEGKYTASKEPGEFWVRAKCEAIRKEIRASITVVKAAPVSGTGYKLLISPDKIKVKPGEKISFQTTLYQTKNGQEQEVWSWPWEYTFFAAEGIFNDAVYTAPKKPGAYNIKVKHAYTSAEAVVIVEDSAGTGDVSIVEIRVNKEALTLDAGASYTFAAQAVDGKGQEQKAALLWKTDGGKIDTNGTFVAGNTPGEYKIKVWEPISGVDKEITVTVRPPAQPKEYRIVVQPENLALNPGQKINLTIKLYRGIYEVFAWPWDFKVVPSAGSFLDNVYTAPNEPGEYFLTIQHEKAAARARLTVRPPKLSKITITPVEATLKQGQEQQFQVNMVDENNKPVSATVIWECAGGKIDAKGLFIAGNEGGKFIVRAKVPHTQYVAEARIIIQVPVTTKLTISPENPQIATGDTIRFKVLVSRGSKPVWAWPWEFECTATGGAFEETKYTAPNKPGVYTITVRYKQWQTQTQVTVQEKSSLIEKMELVPAQVTLHPLQRQKFTVKTFDKTGQEIRSSIRWEASGGTIDEEGIFMAGAVSGTYSVQATEIASGRNVSSVVTITRPLEKIILKPINVVLQPGETCQFKAFGMEAGGGMVPIPVVWSASGGTVNQDGVFTAGNITGKDYMVWGKHDESDLQGFSTVGISDFVPMQLKVTPENVTMKPDDSVEFQVTAYDIHSNPIPITPQWFATGGNVTQNGVYRSGEAEGNFYVTAIEPKSHLFVKAFVNIKRGTQEEDAPVKGYVLKVSPNNRVVKAGENVVLKPTLIKNGLAVWTWPWEYRYIASGGVMVGEYGNIWIAPKTPGQYVITISHRDALQKCTFTVVPDSPDELSQLVIIPSEVVLAPGQKQNFVVKAYDINGQECECRTTWTATGGNMDEQGNYQAGSTAGTYKVVASSGKLEAVSKVTITDQTSAYQLGREWGKSLRENVVTRFQLKKFISTSMFTKADQELDQFRRGFVDSYGPAGVHLLQELLCHIANEFGKLYGHNLYWGNITKSEMVQFVRLYIKRLPPTCHHMFRKGFIDGYKDPKSPTLFDKVWEDAE